MEINSQVTTLRVDIKQLKDGMNIITQQKCQIELLKKRCDTDEENIGTLKSIISKQQRTLNNLDADERDRNLTISGLCV